MIVDLEKEPLTAALQYDCLGFYTEAQALYQDIISKSGKDCEQARYLQRKMHRRLIRFNINSNIEWQRLYFGDYLFDTQTDYMSESHWFNYIFGSAKTTNCDQNKMTHYPVKQIIFIKELSDVVRTYIEMSFYSSISTIVVYGDEWYRGSGSDYYFIVKYSDLVIVPYYCHALDNLGKIISIPPGWLSHAFPICSTHAREKTAKERTFRWAFIGDINKSTREEMLINMAMYESGYRHIIEQWNDENSLTTEKYREILDNTIFAPCPQGWANLDSYRVWEALEAGCIPIVEKRNDFDYFRLMCGPHPMPTVRNWNEVHDLLSSYKDLFEIERLRRSCSEWWTNYKACLVNKIEDNMTSL